MPEQNIHTGNLTRFIGIRGMETVFNFDLFLPHDCGELTHFSAAINLTPTLASGLSGMQSRVRTAGELLLRRPDEGDFFLSLPVNLLSDFNEESLSGIKEPEFPFLGGAGFSRCGAKLLPLPTRVKGECRFISGVYFDRINQTLGTSDYYPLLLNLRYRRRDQ